MYLSSEQLIDLIAVDYIELLHAVACSSHIFAVQYDTKVPELCRRISATYFRGTYDTYR